MVAVFFLFACHLARQTSTSQGRQRRQLMQRPGSGSQGEARPALNKHGANREREWRESECHAGKRLVGRRGADEPGSVWETRRRDGMRSDAVENSGEEKASHEARFCCFVFTEPHSSHLVFFGSGTANGAREKASAAEPRAACRGPSDDLD